MKIYNLYMYDELLESFHSEQNAYEFVRESFPELLDEAREADNLKDATDEYIISILLDPTTDGLALVEEG